MMYIHYCTHCDRIHMLNGHKTSCPACGQPLKELSVSFWNLRIWMHRKEIFIKKNAEVFYKKVCSAHWLNFYK